LHENAVASFASNRLKTPIADSSSNRLHGPSPVFNKPIVAGKTKGSAPPEPFGIYVEAVKEGSLLFLNGMFRTQGREAKSIGRVGSELLRKVFGKDRNLAVFVYAVASLPIGAPIELEVIFEVGG